MSNTIRRIALVLALLCLIPLSPAFAQDLGQVPSYTQPPATAAQIEKWLDTITLDELVQDLVKLDRIEKSIPSITYPASTQVLSEKGTLVVTFTEDMKVVVGEGDLRYSVALPPIEVPNFVEIKPTGISLEKMIWTCAGVGAGGVLVGMILEAVLTR